MARRYGGTGLGLVIARGLVELMGGTLALSSAPGRGTTVEFELPLAGVVLVEVSASELWIARLPSAPSCASVAPALRLSATAVARRYVR